MTLSISTERFYIRELTLEDANQGYLDWFKQSAIKKYIANVPNSLLELTQYIEENQANKQTFLFGIFPHNSNQHIGNIRYEFAYDTQDKVDMGILIGDEQWRGKGVAAEAISASAQFFKEKFDIKQVVLGVDSANIAAVNVYEKIGFYEKEKILIEAPEKIGLLMVWDLLD
ncbi:GNAT family N-acetyltransferase [Colwellia sp. 1_MG-2023]|uniref:GNAT family N-acetyltransferase n=1 Tax=Colwellia sp. 1_MG-2023 TaxID=3062649 RepID=UPI0026E25116|nr:GNAT family N-acetyltransferase [Colwellia sp. 1_MG-2023]MDO6444388.1 GNAT family N-acetyltransferase [Colwellia sp. 1_MG-2023]